MTKLDDFIYYINAGSTNVDMNIDSYVDFINKKSKIDKKNCISLKKMVDIFNNRYQVFLSDYKRLPKLDICSDIRMVYYDEVKEDNFRIISMDAIDLVNPIDGLNTMELIMYQKDTNYEAKLINGPLFGGLKEKVDIDTNMIKTYVDFAQEYRDVMEAYSNLRNGQVCGCGSSSIYTQFYEKEEVETETGKRIIFHQKELDELNSFGFSIISHDFSSEEYVELEFGLNENTIIRASKAFFDGNKTKLSYDELNKIISQIYINRDRLPRLYENNHVRKLEKRK